MFNRSTWIILGLAVLAALIGGLWQRHEQAAAPRPAPVAAPLVGHALPPLPLRDLDGNPQPLPSQRGQRVLLNLWASWCQPCLDEMPLLQRAHAAGAQIVGIAMDEPTRVRAFLHQHPVDYPQRLGRWDPPSTTLLLGDPQEVLPYSVLLDGDGQVLATHLGALDAATLARWLDPKTQAF